MSKIALEGNASGTGTFTLASPNSSTDRTLDLPDASGVIDRLNRAGNVLQVVSATKTDTVTSSATGLIAISGLSVSLTPSSASSKFLLIGMISLSANNTGRIGATFTRGGSAIAIGDADGSMTRVTVNTEGPASNTNNQVGSDIMLFLDSPATTSSVTYAISVNNFDGQSWTVNRNQSSTNSTTLARSISTITVMEIAG